MKNRTYTYQVKELSNGNGWTTAVVVDGRAFWEQPNLDIGETYENQLGFKTRAEAVSYAKRRVQRQRDDDRAWEAVQKHLGDFG